MANMHPVLLVCTLLFSRKLHHKNFEAANKQAVFSFLWNST